MNQEELRFRFLNEFVKRMIIKSSPRSLLLKKQDSLMDKLYKKSAFAQSISITSEKKEVLPILPKEFIEEKKEIQVRKEEPPKEQIVRKEVVKITTTTEKTAQSKPLQPSIAAKEPQALIQPAQAKEEKTTITIAPLQPAQKQTIPTMERLLPFIADLSVSAINCPGPGKNIILTRMGMNQQINMILTKEEIKSFLDEISLKTKIPLVSGLFKVIYQNLLITAIISDYLDNKFLIEKRMPSVLQAPVAAAPQTIIVKTAQPVRVQFK